MVACGGNSGSGIFGEMPNIYREKIVEFALKGKSMAEDVKDCSHEEALAMLEEVRESKLNLLRILMSLKAQAYHAKFLTVYLILWLAT